MKKLFSLIIAAVISVTVFCMPSYAQTGHVNSGDTVSFNGATSSNAFGDLLNWNGIVFGDVNNVIDIEGSLAVGGSLNSTTGLSVNGGAYGANPASTEDVALLVNGNIDIKGYGNVWGQTVIGNPNGNTYRLSNVTPSQTTNGSFTVADSSKFFADAKNTAYGVKSAVEKLPVNGVYHAAYGTYTFAGDPSASVLVYNVDDSAFNSYLLDFTVSANQTVVVNLTSTEAIKFRYGAVKINGSMDPNYLRKYNRSIIINVVNSSRVEMTSCELYGTLLAPDAVLTGGGANICGTTVLNGLSGSNGFELHVGSDNSFIPCVPADASVSTSDGGSSDSTGIRIDVPKKMAVAFDDGTVYYGGETKEVAVGREYLFQMCAVNWENGIFDGNENGIRGTVVYKMTVVHRKEFEQLAAAAVQNPERYTVKGIDIIDNVEKKIIINCDTSDFHLETDVNNFFMAYRFHFQGQDYNKKTGINKVVNNPVESLSVNLPLGSTIACTAHIGSQTVDTAYVFITNNSGKGVYENQYLTSVNDYTWNH